MKRYLIKCVLVLILGFYSSCYTDEFIVASPQLVVEGYIDDGGFPVVVLTTTVPVKSEYTSYDELEENLVKWAKVTVSDGEEEVVLTGKKDERYFPPYFYTTGRMRGRHGKSYKLTVEYENFYAEAVTTIPEPVQVDSFCIEQVGEGEYRQLTAHFTDNPSTTDYYAFFVSDETDSWSFYRLASQGVVADAVSASKIRIPIYRPPYLEEKDETYSPYFCAGDNVYVKFVRMDSVSYHFWNSFEEVRSLSRNPLFRMTDNMKTNIKGALGYWCGYGANIYPIHFLR